MPRAVRPKSAPPVRPGLFRSAVAAPPATLARVMQALSRRGALLRVGRALRSGRIPLAGGAVGEGWEIFEFSGQAWLVTCDCEFREDRVERVPSEGLTEFHYTLTGPVRLDVRRAAADAADLDLVACRAGSRARYEVTCAPGRRRSVAVFARSAWLRRFLDPDTPGFAALARELGAVAPTEVYVRTLPIDRALTALVDQIMRNPYDDRRRLLYAEAKCAELVCATLGLWAAHDGAPARHGESRIVLRPRDIQMLEQARRLILDDLSVTRSLPGLARAVGTNTAKLTAGFRFLFGQTVHQFSLKSRMERALELLSDGQCPVGEVAHAVGYRHQSSFTTAFRQYFGFAPAKARAAARGGKQAAGTPGASD